MRKIRTLFGSVLVIIFFFSSSAFASPTPYGPGFGFNTAPDLGTILSPVELQQKATLSWFQNRFRTLFSRHAELQGLDSNVWAQNAYNIIQSGQIVENSVPVGAILKDVSFTGGGWTADRIWAVAEGYPSAPQAVWDLSMFDPNTGVVLKLVVAKRCGNLEYVGLEVQKPTPPPPPPPGIPQMEIPEDKVPPMAYFWGQYSAPAKSKTGIFQARSVSPVSDLPKPVKINMSQSQGQRQSNNQVNNNNQTVNQPTRSIRISTFATGGGGFGFGEGYGTADASAGASGSASASGVVTGGGGPGGGGGGVATSTGSSTATGTDTSVDGGGLGGGGGWGGNSGILIEGEW